MLFDKLLQQCASVFLRPSCLLRRLSTDILCKPHDAFGQSANCYQALTSTISAADIGFLWYWPDHVPRRGGNRLPRHPAETAARSASDRIEIQVIRERIGSRSRLFVSGSGLDPGYAKADRGEIRDMRKQIDPRLCLFRKRLLGIASHFGGRSRDAAIFPGGSKSLH